MRFHTRPSLSAMFAQNSTRATADCNNSLYELAVAAVCPRIVTQAKADAIRNAGVVIEKKNLNGIGRRVGQVDFPEDLERLCRHLAGVRSQPVRYLKAVLIRLVL